MKTITKYIADDGKEFTNQEECKNYEKNKWFIEMWEKDELDIYDGEAVLGYLSQHCIITKKPEAPSAKKVLNKGKNN